MATVFTASYKAITHNFLPWGNFPYRSGVSISCRNPLNNFYSTRKNLGLAVWTFTSTRVPTATTV